MRISDWSSDVCSSDLQGHSVAGNGVRARRSPAILPLSTRETTMLTLYDYLPSQNAWKVRQLLYHLGLPHRTEHVGIFEGEGRRESFLRISPAGTVPAIELDDGRVLAEPNAILCFFANGTPYPPGHAVARAQGWPWLSFEQERLART